MQKTISQNGVTWTFDSEKQVGQYVNGEYWVVGPVNIVSISPYSSANPDRNGSMVNPTRDKQGLDSRSKGERYVSDLNISKKLPYTAKAGESIMSAVSHNTFDDGYISKVAVLTVVSSAPESGSFRPNWYGPRKFTFNEKDLDYSILTNLKPTQNSISPAVLKNKDMKHVLIDLFTGGASANSEFKANSLTPHYGREISKASSQAVLSLLLDYPKEVKRDLLIEVVQRGIDSYGAAKNGYIFTPDGGHNHGRKLPMFLAAKVLKNSDMLALCDATKNPIFQEDQQHDFVNANWTKYPASERGKPAWAAQALTRLDRPEPDWESTGYRFINGQGNVGVVLAALLLGGRKEWNHEAFFRYIIEEYWPREKNSSKRGIGSANGIPRFTHEMWTAYFDKASSGGQTSQEPTPPQPDILFKNSKITPSWAGNVSVNVFVPAEKGLDFIIGLTDTDSVSVFSDMAAGVRFSKEGTIDVRDGAEYVVVSTQYKAGDSYNIDFLCDLSAQTYSVSINGDIVFRNAKFRDGRLKVEEIDNVFTYGNVSINSIKELIIVEVDTESSQGTSSSGSDSLSKEIEYLKKEITEMQKYITEKEALYANVDRNKAAAKQKLKEFTDLFNLI